MREIHAGNIGTRFNITIKNQDNTVVDLSLASGINFIFKKPSANEVTVAATLTNTGTDGNCYYITTSGFLDEKGVWEIQAQVQYANGNLFNSDIEQFRVYLNL